MISDAIKSRLSVAPFKPFVVKLGSGQSYTVRDPELVSFSPGGRHMILWIGDERYVDIDVLLVETLEAAPENGTHRPRSA